MALQIKRVAASDFTPAAGSRISFDTDHLKCDDYIVGSQTLFMNGAWRNMVLRSDGDFRLNGYYRSKFVKMPSTLDSYSWTDLSDGDNNHKYGMCLDDENNIYFTTWANPGHCKKYADDGTLQWSYTGVGSTPGTINRGSGLCFYNDLIFIGDVYNSYIHIIDKSGNFVNEIDVTAGGSTLTLPTAMWVDNTGIYAVGNLSYLTRWSSSDYSFIENMSPIPFGILAGKGAIRKLSNGDFMVMCNTDYRYDTISYFLLGSDVSIKRIILGASDVPANEIQIGLIQYSQSGHTLLIDEVNQFLYVTSLVGSNTIKILKMDIRDASERTATYQYDFGADVNIQRLNLNSLPNNSDENWKSLRLWYQVDGKGYNEVDLKNPLLDINGQELDLKVGMTSYGFLRNWPEVYSVDIVYNDGKKDIGERTFEALETTKETEIIDISNELEVLEL